MAQVEQAAATRSSWREIVGILVATLGLMLLLGVISYHPAEIHWFRNTPIPCNWIGPVGAYTACFIFIHFGVAGFALPFFVLWIGISAVFWSSTRIHPRVLWFIPGLFCLAGLVDMNSPFWHAEVERLNIGSAGGLMGEVLAHRTLGSWIGQTGAGLVFFVLLVISAARMLDAELVEPGRRLRAWFRARRESAAEERLGGTVKAAEGKRPKRQKIRRRKKSAAPGAAESVDIRAMVEQQQAGMEPMPVNAQPGIEGESPPSEHKQPSPGAMDAVAEEGEKVYQLPPLALLDPVIPRVKGMSAAQVADTAQVLQAALEEFGIEVKVTGVQQGPVVTCYEILPSTGVRVERIKALADNIALKMQAESIRIQAPIPGKGVCGVEVPNPSRAGVFLRDLVERDEARSKKRALPLVLGKDVSGTSMILDLSKMPHMLIAGATGAGKSVCMNTILTGLLMKCTPADLRLILVDPKAVEFNTYNSLPHLVVPVITDAKKVSLGLRWAIDEMERRFKWFQKAGVRDLTGFNANAIMKQEDFLEEEVGKEEIPPKQTRPNHLPYIVIVIDELADLMAVAQAEIEAGIARLAAKSRAAGIHMILATQRPDVKVITGTIKANFPARVAFKVSQKVDSRTILDRMGADTLLGKGDMLVLPPGSDKLIRSQGAFTSDGEIERVTNFWKEQSKPEFIAEIQHKIEKAATDLPEMDDGGGDETIEQAIEVIRQTKRASTSSLQRRLRIGYTRAARVMDLLEERGIVGPPDGAGPREILIDMDGEIPKNKGCTDVSD